MLNSVHLIGRLGANPDLRHSSSGTPIARFSIAVDDGYKKDADPLWVPVIVRNKPAEACHEYLRKGSLVFVGGRLRSRSWVDKDGTKRTIMEVIANQVQFLEPKRKEEPVKVSRNSQNQEYLPFK